METGLNFGVSLAANSMVSITRRIEGSGGEIESGGEAGLSLREEVAEALIGVVGGAKAGELAHGPEAAAVHRGMNTTSVGRFAGQAELGGRIPGRQIGFGVQPANGMARNGGEFGVAFGTFCQCWGESFFFPGALFRGGGSFLLGDFFAGESLRGVLR